MKRFKSLLCLLLLSSVLYAQNETSTWYFGINMGLDFSSGPPVLLDSSKINSREVAASISDQNGNLLFYTDGVAVLNRFHDTMPNGTGLKANASATQGALIVPHPGNASQYYLFTVTNEGRSDGLKYNLVDMTLDNGRGDVALKNRDLVTPVGEKLTAVHHRNGKDIWVVAHGFLNNNFYAYLVTENGLDETPVVSSIGPVHGVVEWDGFAAIGNMRLSHCGNYISCVRYNRDTVELYRFDNCNGMVYDYLPIISENPELNFNGAYGLEFSPDDSKLYLGTFQTGLLFQMSLDKYSKNDIERSIREIGRCDCITMGDLQLAPDGKIYVTYENFSSLGVIENPDLDMPNAFYIKEALRINPDQALTLTLPDFVQSLVHQGECDSVISNSAFLGDDTLICMGDTLKLRADQPGATYEWHDGSTGSGFTVTSPGVYYVEVFLSACVQLKDTITVGFRNFNKMSPMLMDTVTCAGIPLALDATDPSAVSYRWDNGSRDPVREVSAAGDYWVRVTDGFCRRFDTVHVTYIEALKTDWISDTTLCKGDVLHLAFDPDMPDVEWSDGNTETNRSFTVPGKYYVRVSNECETVIDSMNLVLENCDGGAQCFVHLPNAFTPDRDALNDLYKVSNTCDLLDFEMLVYNRWGQLLFRSDDPEHGWDGYYRGVLCETGAYLALVKFRSAVDEGERAFMFYLIR